MKSNKLRQIYIYLALYIAMPLLVLELFSQFRFSNGYFLSFLKLFKNTDKITLVENSEAGLHAPSLNLKNTYKTIYGDPNTYKKIAFKTDIYGTIYPSAIEKINMQLISLFFSVEVLLLKVWLLKRVNELQMFIQR